MPGEPEWLTTKLGELPDLSTFEQLVVLVGVVAPSALVAERFVLPVLQWAEGYWPAWLEPVQSALTAKKQRRMTEAQRRRKKLGENLDRRWPSERREYAALDRELEVRTPAANLLPTKLGNILRAAETRPEDKYGLAIWVCWPRLWLLLPDGARKELVEARSSLDTGARVLFWGLLFSVWTVWSWWAAPVSVGMVVLAYRGMVDAAGPYGSLLESTFDVYRMELHAKTGWPLPDPDREIEDGRELTRYLWHRPDAPTNRVDPTTLSALVAAPTGAQANGTESSTAGEASALTRSGAGDGQASG